MSHKNDTIDHINKTISKMNWSAYDTAYGSAIQNPPLFCLFARQYRVYAKNILSALQQP